MTKFIYTLKIRSNQRIKKEIKKLKYPKAFIDYSQTIDNVYEKLEGYNPMKKKIYKCYKCLMKQIKKLVKNDYYSN